MQEVVGSSPSGSIPRNVCRVPEIGTPVNPRRCGLRRELARCYTAQRGKECTRCKSGNGNVSGVIEADFGYHIINRTE